MGYGAMEKNKGIGTVYILLSAILWGTAGIFVRGLDSFGIHSMQTVFCRAVFTVLFLALYMALFDRKKFRVHWKDLWLFAATGLFSIVLFNYCYYRTMGLATLSFAAVLLYTAPIFVMIFSVFLFGDKMTLRKTAACLAAFLGCCFVSGLFEGKQSFSSAALGFGLLTGFGYALYTIFGTYLLRRNYDSLTITFYVFLFASIFSMFLCDAGTAIRTTFTNRGALFFVIGMAMINTVLPYIFYTNGLQSVSASQAPILATLEPVVATLFGTVLFHEPIRLNGFIGIALVIFSIILLNVQKRRKRQNET